MEAARYFPQLDRSASEIFKYINVLNDFTLLLHNGDIIKFNATNETEFCKWLDDNGIENIRKEKGWFLE